MLAGLRLRFYGVLLGVFGLVSLLGGLYESYKYDFKRFDSGVYLVAVALVLAGGLLCLSKRHLASALRENRLMNFLLITVIGARKTLFDETQEKRGSLLAAAATGALLGCLAYLASPLLVLIGLFGLIAVYTVLIIPEFGVVYRLRSRFFAHHGFGGDGSLHLSLLHAQALAGEENLPIQPA